MLNKINSKLAQIFTQNLGNYFKWIYIVTNLFCGKIYSENSYYHIYSIHIA